MQKALVQALGTKSLQANIVLICYSQILNYI